MKYKKFLIILCALLFFLAALTSYINRVVFPRLIKKIAIERIEKAINRKVEIGSIRFSWVKGFVIDKIKVYERSPADTVFAQADQVSFGVLFFPGIKHYRITIPFINVRSPSVRLIRTGTDSWNFSDMLTGTSDTAQPTAANAGASPFEIAWGGIAISDGKCQINDVSNDRHWKEFFNDINLKLSLSYKGISYDFTADIPAKNGSIGATVYYQPITKNTQAQIHLKNIDTASYLSLIDIPDVHLASGIIKEIDLNINYTQDKTSAQGDILMKDLDITDQDQHFKGDIEIRNLDAFYQNGDITARGQMALNHIQTTVPGFTAGGSVQARVGDLEYINGNLTLIASLQAEKLFVDLKDRQVKADQVVLDNIRVRKDKDGIQSVGSITTRGLFVQWPDQNLQGDIALKAVTMRMKDMNDISLDGELQADNFSTRLDHKDFKSRHILLDDIHLEILEQKNWALTTKLSLTDLMLDLGEKTLSSGAVQTDKLSVNLEDGIINASAVLNATKAKLILGEQRSIEADPRLELSLQMPLNKPQEVDYKGSVTLSDGHLEGFGPVQSLDNIELDADFHNDEATINALSVNILDTDVRITGTVKDFKAPYLTFIADATELNLSKMKELFPKIIDQYGLVFNGTSFVKVQFEGAMADPLSAKILAVASMKNVSVTSNTLHQRIKNITGIIEATPNSLKWRDFTATYLGKKYSLGGTIDDLKNPKIITSIEGDGLQLKADVSKKNNVFTINSLTGKVMKVAFDTTGTITLRTGGKPPVLDINTNATALIEDLIRELPPQQVKNVQSLNLTGMTSLTAELKGSGLDWKDYDITAVLTSPAVTLYTYKMTDLKINMDQEDQRIKNLTFDGKFYDGNVHAVGSMDLLGHGMPYDLALNIDNTDLHLLKMDSPLRMNEINGKFYFTSLAHGTMADFKDKLHATGSLAIRDGYLGEFNLFKGLLDVLNDSISLSKVMITDVESNFTIDDQKINTENLRLKGPTIVLLGKGWVNFDQICDLNMTVDLSSGVFPAMAHDVLQSLSIRVYDKISAPKFKKKISVPQVINTLIKNLLQ